MLAHEINGVFPELQPVVEGELTITKTSVSMGEVEIEGLILFDRDAEALLPVWVTLDEELRGALEDVDQVESIIFSFDDSKFKFLGLVEWYENGVAEFEFLVLVENPVDDLESVHDEVVHEVPTLLEDKNF